jgi:hypothetical protein
VDAKLPAALINGERDLQVHAALARGRLRWELPALELILTESVYHPSRPAHRLLELIDLLEWQIVECAAPLAFQIEQLTRIPGIAAEAYSGSGR